MSSNDRKYTITRLRGPGNNMTKGQGNLLKALLRVKSLPKKFFNSPKKAK